jgi:hypothetical protein
MDNQTYEYKEKEEVIVEEGKTVTVINTPKSECIAISTESETSYTVSVEDKFKHKKDQEIAPQVILHSIQTLVDETQEYLISHNIKDVSPIVYLLNIHRAKKIRDICKATGLKENLLISAFLENTFETNFSSSSKEVLINLCISDEVAFEKISSFLDESDEKLLKSLLDLK